MEPKIFLSNKHTLFLQVKTDFFFQMMKRNFLRPSSSIESAWACLWPFAIGGEIYPLASAGRSRLPSSMGRSFQRKQHGYKLKGNFTRFWWALSYMNYDSFPSDWYTIKSITQHYIYLTVMSKLFHVPNSHKIGQAKFSVGSPEMAN